MLKQSLHVIILLLLVGIFSFSAQSVYAELSVTLTSPADGAVFPDCSDILLTADAQITEGEISEVRFYYNGLSIGRARKAPWELTWSSVKSGNYFISARAKADDGTLAYSDSIKIRVGDISNGDILINGNFSCTVNPWLLETSESGKATISVVNEWYFDDSTYLYVNLEDGSSSDWHVQVQQVFPLSEGHTYELSFLADAEDVKSIAAVYQEARDPYTTHSNTGVSIEGAGEYGPYTFECLIDDPACKFRFYVGGNNINCMFDNVRIIDKSLTSVSAKNLTFGNGIATEYELFQSYPNPFNMNTTIPFRLSKTANVVLNIYNLQGQLVNTLVNETRAEGQQVVHWDGTDVQNNVVPSGVYFYRMLIESENVQLSRKVLLLK